METLVQIIEKEGDLFYTDTEHTLVHCISADCKMGAGIAKQFRARYPEMPQALLEYIKERQVVGRGSVGTAIYYLSDSESKHDVINLITKKFYWQKPTYETFIKAVRDLHRVVVKHDIRCLAMPRIGCGLDKLEWSRVRSTLEEVFKHNSIIIYVYTL